MPRYRFDLVDHRTAADQGRQLVESDELARAGAERLATPESRLNAAGDEADLIPLDGNAPDA
jgi:hypothetical protein